MIVRRWKIGVQGHTISIKPDRTQTGLAGPLNVLILPVSHIDRIPWRYLQTSEHGVKQFRPGLVAAGGLRREYRRKIDTQTLDYRIKKAVVGIGKHRDATIFLQNWQGLNCIGMDRSPAQVFQDDINCARSVALQPQ